MTIMNLNALPFSLRQLQYALAVADSLHFGRAAERCAVAQPSLSAQLAALEEALGLPLFERGAGGVKVTPGGARLLARMRETLVAADELAREASTLRDPLAGQLRLGIIPTLAPYLLPFLAPALREAFPALQPIWNEEHTNTLVARLRSGELEGAFLAREADLGDLDTCTIGMDPFMLCVPKGHRLARSTTALRVERVEGEALLLLEDGHCLREQALAACSRAGLREREYRATSLSTLVQMVAGGAGLTLLPRLAAATEAARADVVLRPLAKPGPFRTLALAWRPGCYAATALRRVGEAAARAYRAQVASGM